MNTSLMPVRILPAPDPSTDKTRRAASRAYMRHLDRLVRMELQNGCHESKRANWPKFCCRCGSDISDTARYVRRCSSCLTRKQERAGGKLILRVVRSL